MTEQEWTDFKAEIEGHTKGPWGQPDGAEHGVMSIDPDTKYPRRSIHSMPPQPVYDRASSDDWWRENIANAALIAAAPTLVAEVERLRNENARLQLVREHAVGVLQMLEGDDRTYPRALVVEIKALGAALTGSSQ